MWDWGEKDAEEKQEATTSTRQIGENLCHNASIFDDVNRAGELIIDNRLILFLAAGLIVSSIMTNVAVAVMAVSFVG